ncbi:MAG: hypothetical protein AAGI63_01990, partial [Planctomycetota bacterium]
MTIASDLIVPFFVVLEHAAGQENFLLFDELVAKDLNTLTEPKLVGLFHQDALVSVGDDVVEDRWARTTGDPDTGLSNQLIRVLCELWLRVIRSQRE